MILLALSHIKIHAYGVDDLRFPFLILFPYLVTSNERYRVISGKRRRVLSSSVIARGRRACLPPYRTSPCSSHINSGHNKFTKQSQCSK
jgi:hypothetical protein